MVAVGLYAVALGFGTVGDGTISVDVAVTANVTVGVGMDGTVLSQATSKKMLASKARLAILFRLIMSRVLSGRDVAWEGIYFLGSIKLLQSRGIGKATLTSLSF
jgi:hypothetical protein